MEDVDEVRGTPDPQQIFAKWLGRSMRIKMTDGRTLIGQFVCTDKDKNVILSSAQEYLDYKEKCSEEPRILGLAMVPGKYIVSMQVDVD